ncbi:HIT family protein [Planctomycetota bacterium]
MSKDDCIFCKMVGGEIPAEKIYEDDVVLAFLDIGPLSDGHTLIIPKEHFEKLDECPPELLGHVSERFGKLIKAVTKAMDCEGYNLLCNNGRAAGQLVGHVHFHLIPRNSGDGVFDRWPAYKYPDGKLQMLGNKIREYL